MALQILVYQLVLLFYFFCTLVVLAHGHWLVKFGGQLYSLQPVALRKSAAKSWH